MAFQATVIPIMIASPGDVQVERNIIREVILEWNDVHIFEEKVTLHPMGWDTHSSPELADRPQELINTRQLKKCDLLVGLFWSKLGTPTGKAKSGTIEEIEEHHSKGKPVMLYFSSKGIPPAKYDKVQIEEVEKFKNDCKKYGLVEEFESDADLKDKFVKHLRIALNENPFLQSLRTKEKSVDKIVYAEEKDFNPITDLSDDERTLLKDLATKKSSGYIVVHRPLGGSKTFMTGNKAYGNSSERESAKWESIIDNLLRKRMLKKEGKDAFKLTHEGWNKLEELGLNKPSSGN